MACGAKLAKRIDARTLQSQGLNANVLRYRHGMKKLAQFWNSLDVKPLLVKVEQIVDANLPFAPQPPSNATR